MDSKALPWKGYKVSGSVQWAESLDRALARAQKEKKPVLLYQLVGDLRLEGC